MRSHLSKTCTFDPGLSDSMSREEPCVRNLEAQSVVSEVRKCYRVLLEKGQDGWIVAKSVDLRGAISQGKNVDEALRNIIEAISVILEHETGQQDPEFLVSWEERAVV